MKKDQYYLALDIPLLVTQAIILYAEIDLKNNIWFLKNYLKCALFYVPHSKEYRILAYWITSPVGYKYSSINHVMHRIAYREAIHKRAYLHRINDSDISRVGSERYNNRAACSQHATTCLTYMRRSWTQCDIHHKTPATLLLITWKCGM